MFGAGLGAGMIDVSVGGMLARQADVISLQNEVSNADVLRAALPAREVLAGMVPGRGRAGSGRHLRVSCSRHQRSC